MAKISHYRVTNFSGGVRRDVSPTELQKNELLDARNVVISDKGRIVTRRGSQQFGQTLTGSIENSFVFVRIVSGSAPTVEFLVNNNAATSVVSVLRANRLSTSITTASTSVVMAGAPTGFPSSGTVEIDGDLIAFTGRTGSTLTGVTGIATSHSAGAAVNVWITLAQSGTAMEGQSGIHYAILNNILFMTGRATNMKQFDGTTVTDVTGEPSALFLTNYRDRLYAAGDAGTGTNGDPRRVSFSNRGDGTTWTTATDFFDVEDQRGDSINALNVFNDRLVICKTNSVWAYDEIELKKQIDNVGAYNHKVLKELNGVLYTFCPAGIFATNAFSAQQIGEPVREYWNNFFPVYGGSSTKRVCTNTSAWTFQDSYLLLIGDITAPDTATDVVLEYNTRLKSWTVHQGGFTDFVHTNDFYSYKFGEGEITPRQAVFAGDSGGKMWRLYENRYVDEQSTPVFQGSDILQDLVSDTGNPVSSRFETPLYDLTYPELWKTFGDIRFITESGLWNVEYRVENEDGITSYRTLGTVSKTNRVLKAPKDAVGYRMGFRISCVNTSGTSTFNGFIFENTEVTNRT